MTTHPLLQALLPLVDDLSRELVEAERYRRLLEASLPPQVPGLPTRTLVAVLKRIHSGMAPVAAFFAETDLPASGIREALRPLIGSISVEAMRSANYAVDRDQGKVSPAEAARALHP